MQVYVSLSRLFSGNFSFQRYISEPLINLNGIANFETIDRRIIYRENGQYSLADKLQSFYQNRIFILGEGSLQIYKEDHSLLHEFVMGDQSTLPLELTHKHLCRDDQYFLTMNIHSFDNYSTSYHIKGPNKGYNIHTDYEST